MLMSGFRVSQQLRSECSPSQLGICVHASSFFSHRKTSLSPSPQYSRNFIAYKHNHYSMFSSRRPDSFSNTDNSCSSSSAANENNQNISGRSFDPINCARQHGTSCSPIIPDGLSSAEDSVDSCPYEGLSSVEGGVVALGKFDALHIGHRELAIQASKIGVPFLMSFVGMAAILGWEPRASIVAECDRKRVLSSWAPLCGNTAPKEVQIDFSKVRSLTPEQFVEKLSCELGVRGVVAGQNYRFGYKASGDATDLVRLCKEHNMAACIINSVMDRNRNTKITGSINSRDQGQVSSTRVRHALANGDMKYVSELLGRDHRLMLTVKNQRHNFDDDKNKFSYPRSCLLNLAPREGYYENCRLVIEGEGSVPCRVEIDSGEIRLEMDESRSYMEDIMCGGGNLEVLGVEFW